MSTSDNNQFNKLIIHYFTGTGNARQVAKWIAEKAKSKNIEAHLINIGKQEAVNNHEITKKTMIGFCYPTHGFNAPPIVLNYLWSFSKSNYGNKFFVVNTRAGMKMSRLFTPGLSGLALLLPALMLITNNFSEKILSGKKMLRGFWQLPIDLAISPISAAYYLYGRFVLSKTYIATNACNQCGLCVESCPVQAITMKNNRPFWSYKCENCMRCMNNCPQRAIETPHGFVTIIYWFVFWILPVMILKLISDYTEAKYFTKDAIYYTLYIILSFVVIFGSYRIMHLLMKFNIVNKIIKYTSLTTYRFWRRYKAPKS